MLLPPRRCAALLFLTASAAHLSVCDGASWGSFEITAANSDGCLGLTSPRRYANKEDFIAAQQQDFIDIIAGNAETAPPRCVFDVTQRATSLEIWNHLNETNAFGAKLLRPERTAVYNPIEETDLPNIVARAVPILKFPLAADSAIVTSTNFTLDRSFFKMEAATSLYKEEEQRMLELYRRSYTPETFTIEDLNALLAYFNRLSPDDRFTLTYRVVVSREARPTAAGLYLSWVPRHKKELWAEPADTLSERVLQPAFDVSLQVDPATLRCTLLGNSTIRKQFATQQEFQKWISADLFVKHLQPGDGTVQTGGGAGGSSEGDSNNGETRCLLYLQRAFPLAFGESRSTFVFTPASTIFQDEMATTPPPVTGTNVTSVFQSVTMLTNSPIVKAQAQARRRLYLRSRASTAVSAASIAPANSLLLDGPLHFLSYESALRDIHAFVQALQGVFHSDRSTLEDPGLFIRCRTPPDLASPVFESKVYVSEIVGIEPTLPPSSTGMARSTIIMISVASVVGTALLVLIILTTVVLLKRSRV